MEIHISKVFTLRIITSSWFDGSCLYYTKVVTIYLKWFLSFIKLEMDTDLSDAFLAPGLFFNDYVLNINLLMY